MKRYAIHISSYVTVEAENVAQAAKVARNAVGLIGARIGVELDLRKGVTSTYRISTGELKFGRPIRLPSNGETPRG